MPDPTTLKLSHLNLHPFCFTTVLFSRLAQGHRAESLAHSGWTPRGYRRIERGQGCPRKGTGQALLHLMSVQRSA
jgi:hypothetical protein